MTCFVAASQASLAGYIVITCVLLGRGVRSEDISFSIWNGCQIVLSSLVFLLIAISQRESTVATEFHQVSNENFASCPKRVGRRFLILLVLCSFLSQILNGIVVLCARSSIPISNMTPLHVHTFVFMVSLGVFLCAITLACTGLFLSTTCCIGVCLTTSPGEQTQDQQEATIPIEEKIHHQQQDTDCRIKIEEVGDKTTEEERGGEKEKENRKVSSPVSLAVQECTKENTLLPWTGGQNLVKQSNLPYKSSIRHFSWPGVGHKLPPLSGHRTRSLQLVIGEIVH
jgi:hypothetical protein